MRPTGETGAGSANSAMLVALDVLLRLFAPFLPFSAERVHGFLGYDRPLFGRSRVETYAEGDWEHEALVYDPVFTSPAALQESIRYMDTVVGPKMAETFPPAPC